MSAEESLATLRFADRARRVKISAHRSVIVDDATLLQRAQLEIKHLRSLMSASADGAVTPTSLLQVEKDHAQVLMENERLRRQLRLQSDTHSDADSEFIVESTLRDTVETVETPKGVDTTAQEEREGERPIRNKQSWRIMELEEEVKHLRNMQSDVLDYETFLAGLPISNNGHTKEETLDIEAKLALAERRLIDIDRSITRQKTETAERERRMEEALLRARQRLEDQTRLAASARRTADELKAALQHREAVSRPPPPPSESAMHSMQRIHRSASLAMSVGPSVSRPLKNRSQRHFSLPSKPVEAHAVRVRREIGATVRSACADLTDCLSLSRTQADRARGVFTSLSSDLCAVSSASLYSLFAAYDTQLTRDGDYSEEEDSESEEESEGLRRPAPRSLAVSPSMQGAVAPSSPDVASPAMHVSLRLQDLPDTDRALSLSPSVAPVAHLSISQ
ncbi:hypothetical protein KIPB_008111, partial [Kipferlia bialata]|eukprot:g8111.t1